MVQKINHKGLWSYLPILLDLFLNLSSESGKKSFILRKCDSKNFLTPCNKVHKNQIRKGQKKDKSLWGFDVTYIRAYPIQDHSQSSQNSTRSCVCR